MEPSELKSIVDLVADIVVCRLEERSGSTPAQDTKRIDRLLGDLQAISSTYGVLPDVLRDVRQSLEDHDFPRIQREIRGLRSLEGPNPPDDLSIELERLADKIASLRNPNTFEYKTPKHVQINVVFLVNILLEILDILKKLGRRSTAQPEPEDSVRFVGVALVRDTEILIISDPQSPLLDGLSEVECSVVTGAFDDIQQSGGVLCQKMIVRKKAPGGGTVFFVKCVDKGCKKADPEGCHLLRHPVQQWSPDKVEDLGQSPPAFPQYDDRFTYWCRCGAYPR